MTTLLIGLLIPLLGTMLGASFVSFIKRDMPERLQKALLGFASGVMVAASVWSLLVLYHLHKNGTLRFNELHRDMADCSQKMLSQTLKRLEQIGLIARTIYPEVPPRVEYNMTDRGESLMPHISALIGWAVEHFEEIKEAEA